MKEYIFKYSTDIFLYRVTAKEQKLYKRQGKPIKARLLAPQLSSNIKVRDKFNRSSQASLSYRPDEYGFITSYNLDNVSQWNRYYFKRPLVKEGEDAIERIYSDNFVIGTDGFLYDTFNHNHLYAEYLKFLDEKAFFYAIYIPSYDIKNIIKKVKLL